MPAKSAIREAAVAAGEKRYFTGVPCRHGHIAARNVANNNCIECQAAYDKANPDATRARARRHYHKDIETNRKKNREAKHREWRRRKPILQARNSAYYAANKERMKADHRAWAKANPAYARAYSKKWRRANQARHRIQAINYVQRRKIRIAENKGSFTVEQIERLHLKQNGRCAFCLKGMNGKYEIDHIDPISRGGSNDISNIQLLHMTCNRRKHSKDPFAYAQEHGRLL